MALKCPIGGEVLEETTRNAVGLHQCPAGHGLWLTRQELESLEDQAFHLGDDQKGTLVFSSDEGARGCPECGERMRTFAYRLWDLELDFCPEGHGFWLDANEDEKLLGFMREEQDRLGRSRTAEQHWSSLLQHLRSGAFIDRLKDLF